MSSMKQFALAFKNAVTSSGARFFGASILAKSLIVGVGGNEWVLRFLVTITRHRVTASPERMSQFGSVRRFFAFFLNQSWNQSLEFCRRRCMHWDYTPNSCTLRQHSNGFWGVQVSQSWLQVICFSTSHCHGGHRKSMGGMSTLSAASSCLSEHIIFVQSYEMKHTCAWLLSRCYLGSGCTVLSSTHVVC